MKYKVFSEHYGVVERCIAVTTKSECVTYGLKPVLQVLIPLKHADFYSHH